MKRADAGFTLLEVMGAVVILGIVGVSLITSSIDSSYRSAKARDLLELSMLADTVLADVELRGRVGSLTLGTEVEERSDGSDDGIEVQIVTQAADLQALAGGYLRERGRDEGPALTTAERGKPPALLQVHITITDPGGTVAERSAFVFDPTASEPLQELVRTEETEPR